MQFLFIPKIRFIFQYMCLKLIIFKVKMPQSSVWCNPAEVLTLKPDAEQWLCDKPFTPTAAAKNTRCFLTCNNGFGVVQGEFDITDDALN